VYILVSFRCRAVVRFDDSAVFLLIRPYMHSFWPIVLLVATRAGAVLGWRCESSRAYRASQHGC